MEYGFKIFFTIIILNEGAVANRHGPLHQYAQGRGLGCKKGSETDTFDKCGGDQHGGLDLPRGLGLTGNGVHGLATDHPDAHTGSDYDQTGTYDSWNCHDI